MMASMTMLSVCSWILWTAGPRTAARLGVF